MKAFGTILALVFCLCCGLATAQEPKATDLSSFTDSLNHGFNEARHKTDSTISSSSEPTSWRIPMDSKRQKNIAPIKTKMAQDGLGLPPMSPPGLPENPLKKAGLHTDPKMHTGYLPKVPSVDSLKQIPLQKKIENTPGSGKEIEWVETADRHKSSVDSLQWDDLDSIAVQRREQLSEQTAGRLETEMAKGMDTDISPENLPGQEELDALREYDLKRLDWKKLQQDHFSDRKVLTAGQYRLNELKSRYTQVTDTRRLEEAIRKNKLEGDSFLQRFEFGGMVHTLTFPPIYAEVKPFVGYRIDKRLSVGGLGLLSLGENVPNGKPIWQGHGIYSLYKFGKGMFATGEYQRRSIQGAPVEQVGRNYQSIFGGLGTEFGLRGRLHVRSSVLYGFNSKEIIRKGGFETPWRVTIGLASFRNQRRRTGGNWQKTL